MTISTATRGRYCSLINPLSKMLRKCKANCTSRLNSWTFVMAHTKRQETRLARAACRCRSRHRTRRILRCLQRACVLEPDARADGSDEARPIRAAGAGLNRIVCPHAPVSTRQVYPTSVADNSNFVNQTKPRRATRSNRRVEAINFKIEADASHDVNASADINADADAECETDPEYTATAATVTAGADPVSV